MGNKISITRKALDSSPGERKIIEEHLNKLEKTITGHLENAKVSILNGERGDKQIHAGTVVEFNKQVNIIMSMQPSPVLKDAINDFFSGTKTLKIRFDSEKLITEAVGAVLSNTNRGEHEGSNMFIQESDNTVYRLDTYYCRWNVSSDEIIQGASGVIVMKCVIDLVKTDT